MFKFTTYPGKVMGIPFPESVSQPGKQLPSYFFVFDFRFYRILHFHLISHLVRNKGK